MKRLILICVVLSLYTVVAAQSEPMPSPIELEAEDGLTLVGDLYLPELEADVQAPAVLLMHMLGSDRSAYEPLIPALVDAGYIVLNVDMRGHGDTGGSIDWDAAEGDIQTWLNWLREQDSVNDAAVGIIGASIGSNLALIGCANDADCVTVIALSPGLDYRGVQPESALQNGLSDRSALLIASHNDTYSAESVEQLFMTASGNIAARLYRGNAHGTNLFNNELESVTSVILSWLDEHLQ